ncbi:MAG TPA: CusA/CzcA family heavy metal efflux RND transporter [Leptospiraceae bacterium]|nr:CusA/CzcA family heavy metal efflux RND transporter [Spirochaetaceae bacterium]HBS05413.1 CusA/CzcA family heavy metal efflux RND transporter [Leptospiraceae bacterium]|tara:strand:+ start:311479 stop:314601 length:3123 start_codon:yes stop_codon:yes gene_type:complete
MINRWIEAATRNPVWVIFLLSLLALLGLRSAVSLPVDAVPDITGVQVMVATHTGAMDPEEIETTVTYPIEAELAGIQNVSEIRSITKYGLSQVNIIFDDSMDVYFARQLIAERLQSVAAALPEGLKPEMGAVTTGLGEVVMYSVEARPGSELASRSPEDRLRYLRTIQEWVIRPTLKTVPGVAEVDSNGGYQKAIFINFDPASLISQGIGPVALVQLLQESGMNRGGGYIERENRRIIVKNNARFKSLDEIKRFPVRIHAIGAPERLTELASVSEGNRPRVGSATHNGEETVLGTILMRTGANSRTVSHESVQKIQSLDLPDDVKVQVLYARSYLVDATIKTVAKNLVEGGVLVILVLLLIAGNFRAALIVSLAIPLSMLAALMGMEQMGISANLMSLGAIDFGLIVDGSVVVIENILRKMEEEPEAIQEKGKAQVILEAMKEVSGPVITGLSIIMIVYVPILLLTGIEGKMFRPMAITVLLALAASLVIALFVMPSLALLFLKPPKPHKFSFFSYISNAFEPVLEYCIRHPYRVTSGSVGVFVLSVLLFFTLGANFLPEFDERDMVIGLTRNADISMDATLDHQIKSEKAIMQFPEVDTVFSRIGTPESATDPMGIHLADTFVILKKNYDEWPERKDGNRYTKAELFDAMSQAIEQASPGQEHSPTQPIAMRFNEMLEGSRADLSLRIFGPDLKQLMGYIQKSEDILREIDGVVEVSADALTALRQSPVLEFRPRPEDMTYWGIDSAGIGSAFEIAMAGHQIASYYEQDRRFPIILRMRDDYRNDMKRAARLPVDLPDGGVVPLSDVASLQLMEQVTTISRINSRRYSSLAIYIQDRDIESVVEEADQRIRKELQLPEEVTIEWAGQYKNLQRARLRILTIIPLTLILIFLLLYQSLKSLRQTLLVLSCIPMAISGGILLLWLRDIPFSVSASVGMIALSGIAILNGTVLVNFFNDLRRTGHSVLDAVFRGTLIRLRPVLMTGLVAGLGFIPMAFNSGTGAEVQRPLATVVVGGLITATILTLFVVPALYYRLERHHDD